MNSGVPGEENVCRIEERSLRELLLADPTNADVLCQLAECQLKDGRLARAMRNLRKSLSHNPGHSQSHLLMGIALQRRGNDSKAREQFGQVLHNAEATPRQLREIAVQAWRSGALSMALDAYGRLIASKSSDDDDWRHLAEVLRLVRVDSYDPSFERLLIACMKREDLDHQDLAACAVSLLKTKQSLAPFFTLNGQHAYTLKFDAELTAMLRDELLLLLLESAIAADAEFEQALTVIRHAMLRHCLRRPLENLGGSSLERFAVALAQQCFLTEFVYSVCREEDVLLDEAIGLVNGSNFRSATPVVLAVTACYQPLYQTMKQPSADREMISELARLATPGFRELIRVQWEEPRQEETFKDTIAVLTPISDATSRAVRAFYEETPYPRWRSVKRIGQIQASRYLKALFPSKSDLLAALPISPKVLVAGCGTGRHAILAARLYAGSDVLAIDLSLASLAFAIRKARELNIGNIRFAQADLLRIDDKVGTYDIIECSGVLVCVEDPFEGMRNLTERLRPGGVMKVSLYSETARQHIVRARGFIEQRGFEPTLQGIRSCRDAIAASSDTLLRQVACGRDFYSTSMVRDLIFHIKEHRFTLDWIERSARTLGLTVLGFELADPIARQRYRALRPSDPDICDFEALTRLESSHPETFAEMYQVWLYRPSEQP